MYIIDKNTGIIKSQVEFEKVHEDKDYGGYIDRSANIHSSPVFSDKKIILGSDDGYIYAIEQKN